ncbi:myb/SANT-like DNA-binding domain-containing protein 7 [Ptychodera flava]|uniref:myb/SANT-like DNA-binding domain-containing protein 7 n=1 Tax=Ptychodera flava TaxID=63121 RepID=UPI00396A84C1
MAAEHSTTSRGNNWSDDEISLLISVWADESIQRMLNGTCRDSLVYKKIAEKALQRGLNRTADQCHRKLKALKLKYKEVVDSNRRSGRGRISMPFFEELSQILGRNTVMESLSIGHHSDEDSINGSDDSSHISPDQATAQDKSDGTSTIATDVNDSRVTTPIGMPLKKRPRRVLTDVEENISPDRGEEPEDAETCERPSPQDDPDDTASAVVKRRTMRIKKKKNVRTKCREG